MSRQQFMISLYTQFVILSQNLTVPSFTYNVSIFLGILIYFFADTQL